MAIIKNEHTKAEMSQLDDEWANHQGPYLTLEQLLDVLDAVERRNEPTRSFDAVKNEILASRNT
jgi:hypothetical protein